MAFIFCLLFYPYSTEKNDNIFHHLIKNIDLNRRSIDRKPRIIDSNEEIWVGLSSLFFLFALTCRFDYESIIFKKRFTFAFGLVRSPTASLELTHTHRKKLLCCSSGRYYNVHLYGVVIWIECTTERLNINYAWWTWLLSVTSALHFSHPTTVNANQITLKQKFISKEKKKKNRDENRKDQI